MKKIEKWQIALIALAIATIIFGSLPVIGYVHAISEPLKYPSYYGIWKIYYAEKITETSELVYEIDDLGIVMLPIENDTRYTVLIENPDEALKWMSNEYSFDKYTVDSQGQIYKIYVGAYVFSYKPTFIEVLEKNKTTIALFDIIIFGCLWIIFGNGYFKRRRKDEENG